MLGQFEKILRNSIAKLFPGQSIGLTSPSENAR
jgi:hypothetical protein